MRSSSDSIINIRRRLQLFLIIGGIAIVAAVYFLIPQPTFNTMWVLTLIWVLLIIGFLWIGNTAINKTLNRVTPWLTFGITRFFTQLFLVLIYSLTVINGSYYLFKTLFTQDPPTSGQYLVMNVYGGVLVIIVGSVYFGILFLRSWRKSAVEAEKMQKEYIKSQLKALQSHIDPHFLFNNLNVLSSLIDKDKEQSKVFLSHFAEVYRGLLRKDLDDIISLKDELEFLQTYIYLIKIRFQENIDIRIDVPEEFHDRYVPPLTLQMLLENAFKHNKITETKPLEVSITLDRESDQIIVQNTLNKKEMSKPSEGSGLDNISERYSFFTDQGISQNESDSYFTVKIPLLKLDR